MAQHRIVEVDYPIFIGELRLARDSNKIIEPVNKEKWAEYLASNDIREVSFNAHAKVRFFHGKHQLVAIVRDSDWDGCYAYSKADEAAIKYVVSG